MERLEDFARRKPLAFAAFLGFAALTLRLSLADLAARIVGIETRDLSLFYDGLSYIYIAKSFPRVYIGAPADFPIFYKPVGFTAFFAFYPLLIRAVDFLLHDARIAALSVSQLSASLAVVVFHRLACRFSARPALAALIFCVFPPTWLLTGSAAMVESVFLLVWLACLLFWKKGELSKAAACAAVAMLTQKSGFLLVAIIALCEFRRGGLRGLRRLWPFALSFAPAALMQVYLGAVFHDPWVSFRIMSDINGPAFQLPFQGFMEGLLSPTQWYHGHFWLRKFLLASSCIFYVLLLAAAWRRRARLEFSLIAWLGVVLLFHGSLGGIRSYFPFPKYMTAAAPAAILLALELLPAALARRSAVWTGLLIAWIPAVLALGAMDIFSAMDLELRMWPRGYFQIVTSYLAGLH